MEVRDADSKRLVLSELLEQGMVLVTLDARHEGVDVPPHLRDDAQLRLNLSYRFGLPMSLDDDGITATLTFSGTPYPCRMPWRSLYLFVSHVTGRPILFPSDVPAEFSLNGLSPSRNAAAVAPLTWNATQRSVRGGRPRLRVITSSVGVSAEDPTTAEDAPPPPPPTAGGMTSPKDPQRRGHLRIIK